MSDILGMGVALLFGALLGAFFFGGLWWTIQKGIASQWVAVWFIGSLLLRSVAVMTGFYFVSQHHWSRFAACVLGFLLARIIVVKWLGRDSENATSKQESGSFGAQHPQREFLANGTEHLFAKDEGNSP